MKKNVLLSLLLVAVLLIGAGLGTYAWFTWEATSETNTFTAGTLKINATQELEDNVYEFVLDNMEPGHITDWYKIKVVNNGSLDAAIFAKFHATGSLARDLSFYDYKVEYFKHNDYLANRWETEDNNFGQNINEDYLIKDGNLPEGTGEWLKSEILEFNPGDALGKWDAEALPKDAYFIVSFRLKYNNLATLQGASAKLNYVVKSTQVKEGAIYNLISGINENTDISKLTTDYLEGVLNHYK
jgi:predicted ribosomally synthesized peptide with SipW-like signal peptide